MTLCGTCTYTKNECTIVIVFYTYSHIHTPSENKKQNTANPLQLEKLSVSDIYLLLNQKLSVALPAGQLRNEDKHKKERRLSPKLPERNAIIY